MYSRVEKDPAAAQGTWSREIQRRGIEAVLSDERLGDFEPVRKYVDALVLAYVEQKQSPVQASSDNDYQAPNFKKIFKISQELERQVAKAHPEGTRKDILLFPPRALSDAAPTRDEVMYIAGGFKDGAKAKADKLVRQGPDAIAQFKAEVAERAKKPSRTFIDRFRKKSSHVEHLENGPDNSGHGRG